MGSICASSPYLVSEKEPFVSTRNYSEALLILQAFSDNDLKKFIETHADEKKKDQYVLCECMLDIYSQRNYIRVKDETERQRLGQMFQSLPRDSIFWKTWERESKKIIIA